MSTNERTTRPRKPKRSRGQALVEFALILPIFLLIVVGVFDLGRAVFAYNSLSDAARAGVRTAIVNQASGVPENAAVKRAIGLGLTPVAVTVTYKDDGLVNPCTPPTVGCVASVTVKYAYHPVTPLLSSFWTTIDMSSTAEMTVERPYAP